ncbi:MAG: EAL domain-containing protein [Rhizobacter sp.]|nr:EAL domain-containing protein [Rhizobacter sp.]
MNAHFDSALAPLLWGGSSLALGTISAQLAFAWHGHSSASGLLARLRRLAGAGLSLGTGIWSVHALAGSVDPAGFAVGYHPWAELVLWLLAIGASMAAFGGLNVKWVRVPPWVAAACGFGCALVVIQALGQLTSGLLPGIDWRLGPLLLGWLACLAGCLLAFGLFHTLNSLGRRAMAWGRLVAGLILGATAVLGQHLVSIAADLPSQRASAFVERLSSGTLTALASIGSAGLLLALWVLLRRQKQARVVHSQARRTLGTLALSDPLTGLPNRQLFDGTLAQAVRQADAGKLRLALLVVNLDDFMPLNESVGQRAGDRLLREVAERLRALSGPHMAARLTGDEFVILQAGDPQPGDAAELALGVLAAINRPFVVDGRNISITCSIGVAMYPEHGAMSTLTAHAAAAMRTAKAAGGASHVHFEARMVNGSRDQADLLRDLRAALERGQLELYYQPKIHAPSGEITGAEALMRWHHPQRGMVSPVVFIPIAERHGLIGALGLWAIDEACRQVRAWRDAGLRMRVAINLSAHQLRQADLADRIAAALQRHEVRPDLITCEITESAAMDDPEVAMRVLGQLAKLGVHISIDDFGTGHSSLSYLRKLPAQELKIDRSFVLDLETSEDARKVASAVINLAKALNLKVVAEGVETEGQNRILREFGCDQLQGYLFAKPMSAKALALWAMDDVGPRTMNFRASLFTDAVATLPG